MESIFQQWECLFIGGFRRKCSWMILFFAITWSLWLVRNELIFRNKDPDYDVFFYILTRLCTWINVLMPEFTYNALDLLISAKGITKWSNSMIPRPQVS